MRGAAGRKKRREIWRGEIGRGMRAKTTVLGTCGGVTKTDKCLVNVDLKNAAKRLGNMNWSMARNVPKGAH